MVKDGVLVELPLYFSVFDSVLIVVMVIGGVQGPGGSMS
jgi:hypothetical protein